MTEPGSPAASAKRRPPLDGVRILAVSQFGAGPFGTQVLADLGAEVIKIEDPGVGGDVARYVPPFAGEADSPYFQSFNRGKRSITLNLRHPDGQAVFHDLVRVSDAVFNNARGDLPGKLGLTYEALKSVNPRVVCCALTGFGTTGPRAAEPAYDYLIQGYAGYMAVTGEPDGPPGKCGVSIIDFAGGYAAMIGLMVGLFDARAHGHRPGRRRVAPRHRGEHAVLLRHLDAQPRLGGRPHAGLGAPDPRARPELPHPRRLDRRLLQQGQVLARPGRGARRARTGGRPALCHLPRPPRQPGDAGGGPQGAVRGRAPPRSGSSGCAGACRARPSTTCARRSPTSRCWRAR